MNEYHKQKWNVTNKVNLKGKVHSNNKYPIQNNDRIFQKNEYGKTSIVTPINVKVFTLLKQGKTYGEGIKCIKKYFGIDKMDNSSIL